MSDHAPCPWCGYPNTAIISVFNGYKVICLDCHATGPEAATKDEANDVWDAGPNNNLPLPKRQAE